MKRIKKTHIVSIWIYTQACWHWFITGMKTKHYFIYSENQYNTGLDIYNSNNTFVKGLVYSEMRGFKHLWTNWEDMKFVAVGDYSDITFKDDNEGFSYYGDCEGLGA